MPGLNEQQLFNQMGMGAASNGDGNQQANQANQSQQNNNSSNNNAGNAGDAVAGNAQATQNSNQAASQANNQAANQAAADSNGNGAANQGAASADANANATQSAADAANNAAANGGSEPEKVEIKFGAGDASSSSAAASATPAFDAKALFGIDITPEEVINRVKNYPAIESELKVTKETNPYADDYVRDLNEARKSGVSRENFDKVYNSDPDKLTPIEKVMLQKQWQLGLSEASAKLIVEDEFHLGLQETEDMTDLQKAEVQRLKNVGNAKLEAASKSADAFLREHKKTLLTPPVQQAAVTQEAIIKDWTPVMPTITKEYEVLQIGTDINIKFPPEELQAIHNLVLDDLKLSTASVDPNNPNMQKMVRAMVGESLIVRNFERIIREIRSHDKVVSAKALLDYKNNPGGNGSSAAQQQSTPGAQPTIGKSLEEMHAKGY